jgi:hypothetical protein
MTGHIALILILAYILYDKINLKKRIKVETISNKYTDIKKDMESILKDIDKTKGDEEDKKIYNALRTVQLNDVKIDYTYTNTIFDTYTFSYNIDQDTTLNITHEGNLGRYNLTLFSQSFTTMIHVYSSSKGIRKTICDYLDCLRMEDTIEDKMNELEEIENFNKTKFKLISRINKLNNIKDL